MVFVGKWSKNASVFHMFWYVYRRVALQVAKTIDFRAAPQCWRTMLRTGGVLRLSRAATERVWKAPRKSWADCCRTDVALDYHQEKRMILHEFTTKHTTPIYVCSVYWVSHSTWIETDNIWDNVRRNRQKTDMFWPLKPSTTAPTWGYTMLIHFTHG